MAIERDRAKQVANGNVAVPVGKKKLGGAPMKQGMSSQRGQGGVGGAGGTAGADQSGTGVQTPSYLKPENVGGPLDAGKAIGGALGSAAHSVKRTVGGAIEKVRDLANTPIPQNADRPGFSQAEEARGPQYTAPNELGNPAGGSAPTGAAEDNYDADYDSASLDNKRLGDFEVQEGENRNVRYSDGDGNFLEGQRPASGGDGGRGSFSVLNTGRGDSGNDPIDYEAQIQSYKDLRQAKIDLQDGRRGGGGEGSTTASPAAPEPVSQYEQEINARNARMEARKQAEMVDKMGFRKANALANLQKAGVAVANQGDTRRGQDIVAGTAANRQANDLYSDTLNAENDAAENQRKLGESQVDFAVRQQKLRLDDRKAAVDANLRQQGLDETTRNNYAKSIEGYNKGMVAGQDPLSMFAGLIEQTDYATASKIDPQNAALYLERMKGQK